MQDFFVGLALLTIGALVATAINHPARYRRIYLIAGGIVTVGGLIAFGHEIGFERGSRAALAFVPPERVEAARAAVEAIGLPVWGGPATFLLTVFFVVLFFIRPLLGISDDGGENGDGHDKPKPPPA